MGTTSDPKDPRITRGSDTEPTDQAETYLVLSKKEREDGFVAPYRDTYIHDVCGTPTTMSRSIAETYAKDPKFYGSTYCCYCRMHLVVSEFKWEDGTVVGSLPDTERYSGE